MNRQNSIFRHSRLRFLLIATCLLFVSCSGGGSTALNPDSVPDAPIRTARDVADQLPPDAMAGVDYTPDIIVCGYLAGAELPEDLRGQPLPDVTADRCSNEILRENGGFTDITDAIAGRYGLTIRTQVYVHTLNSAAFNVPPGADGDGILAALRSEFAPVLEYAGYSLLGHAAFTPNDPDFEDSDPHSGSQWGQRRINAETAWDYTRGDEHLLVGVVDTGVRLYHEELLGQVLIPAEHFPSYNLDLVNDDNTVEDEDGHGTNVSGLIVAMTDNDRTIAGLADGCRVIPVKIASSSSYGAISDMAAGCILAGKLGADVVNMSWVSNNASYDLEYMVDTLVEMGVLLVVSAGNDDHDNPVYPGAYEGCMAVGATDSTDRRVDVTNWGSCYGDFVDIAAPGTGLKTCHRTGLDEYKTVEGTSFSAPLVAAGAALLWSYEPDLTMEGLRTLLETTGAVCYDFSDTHPIKRLDIGAAFQSILTLDVDYLDQLIYRDEITFTAVPNSEITGLRLIVNGEVVEDLTSDPWEVTLDLSSYGFTVLDVQVEGYTEGGITAGPRYQLLVDNTTGVHSFDEGFDDIIQVVKEIDPREYSDAVLNNLKQIDPEQWDIADIRGGAGPSWDLAEMSGTEWSKACRLAEAGHGYWNDRTEILITPCLNLAGMVDAEFSFNTHYNFAESDLGYLLYTTDYGRTFSPVLDDENPIVFSGYQNDYLNYTINLDEMLGLKPYFIFLFESDAAEIGSGAEEDASWWLDDIQLSGTTVSINGINVDMPQVLGTFTGAKDISVSVINPLNVTEVIYWVDYAPLGTQDDYDLIITNTNAPFDQDLDLTAALSRHNEAAILRVTPVGFSSFHGETLTHPVYVFNHRGDTNGDGVVDETDAAAYVGQIGLTSDDGDFNPLCDSDLDGTITELDANYVGYLYGTTWD